MKHLPVRPLTILAAVTLLLWTVPTHAAAKPKIDKHTLEHGGAERTYYTYVPAELPVDAPAPLLVLAHGSGRDGDSLVKEWRQTADEHGIVLTGPEALDTQAWQVPVDGPDFVKAVIDTIAAREDVEIDPRRVYLFGHSAGANFVLNMAMYQSRYFAAGVAHAGAFRQEGEDAAVAFVQRPIPLLLVVGTRDPWFSVDDVRATRDRLAEADVPVELTEIPGHDHDYYGRSKTINADAWEFLSRHRLEGEPEYQEYR
jgi:poly(3-hydroxybutyrate) depolymerase